MILAKLGAIIFTMGVLLRFKVPIGHTVAATSILLWGISGMNPAVLGHAALTTLQDPRGWIIAGALYFIMWLEYLLRTRGVMDGFLSAIQEQIPNRKAVMMIIAAFLGLLPSLGGAIFSAPMVEKISQPLGLSPEKKTLVNYWSRHLCEYANPMAPALLLACATAQVPLSGMLAHLLWYGVLAVAVGWWTCYRGVPDVPPEKLPTSVSHRRALILALGPVGLIFVLILGFKLNAAIATLISTSVLTIVLWRGFGDFKKQVIESFNIKIFWGVGAILFFQSVLIETGTVSELVEYFKVTGFSPAIALSALAFVMGLLTGMSQGFVAISFPLVAGIATGDISLAVLVYVMGSSGQMLTPTHLCLTLTASYFRADLIKVFKELIPMQVVLMVAAGLIYYLGL